MSAIRRAIRVPGAVSAEADARQLSRDGHQGADDAGDLCDQLPGLLFRLDAEGHVDRIWGAGFADAPDLRPGRPLTFGFPQSQVIALEAACDLARREGVASLCLSVGPGNSLWLQCDLAARPGQGLAGRLSDLRAGLEREQALVRALHDAEARSAGKSRFLANLSHELRTPLNAIMGFADTMRQGVLGPLPDRYRGYADLIHESGELLLELISDVLDMARVEAERFDLNLEVFDVREAASAVVRLVRGQVERAGLEFVAPDLRERIEVRADRRALKQMSLNLISNAIKATPPGGRVAFGLAREGEDLVLVVEDTGCGVSEADLARLGRPFEQAGSPDQKAAGAGLGLSLVKALCDLHGGEMTLRSRQGQGTRVGLRLPIVVRDQVQPELDLT